MLRYRRSSARRAAEPEVRVGRRRRARRGEQLRDAERVHHVAGARAVGVEGPRDVAGVGRVQPVDALDRRLAAHAHVAQAVALLPVRRQVEVVAGRACGALLAHRLRERTERRDGRGPVVHDRVHAAPDLDQVRGLERDQCRGDRQCRSREPVERGDQRHGEPADDDPARDRPELQGVRIGRLPGDPGHRPQRVAHVVDAALARDQDHQGGHEHQPGRRDGDAPSLARLGREQPLQTEAPEDREAEARHDQHPRHVDERERGQRAGEVGQDRQVEREQRTAGGEDGEQPLQGVRPERERGQADEQRGRADVEGAFEVVDRAADLPGVGSAPELGRDEGRQGERGDAAEPAPPRRRGGAHELQQGQHHDRAGGDAERGGGGERRHGAAGARALPQRPPSHRREAPREIGDDEERGDQHALRMAAEEREADHSTERGDRAGSRPPDRAVGREQQERDERVDVPVRMLEPVDRIDARCEADRGEQRRAAPERERRAAEPVRAEPGQQDPQCRDQPDRLDRPDHVGEPGEREQRRRLLRGELGPAGADERVPEREVAAADLLGGPLEIRVEHLDRVGEDPVRRPREVRRPQLRERRAEVEEVLAAEQLPRAGQRRGDEGEREQGEQRDDGRVTQPRARRRPAGPARPGARRRIGRPRRAGHGVPHTGRHPSSCVAAAARPPVCRAGAPSAARRPRAARRGRGRHGGRRR